jgi:His/Glu/Gln/Arg/opine family amino acid ABC transporter permease subunit
MYEDLKFAASDAVCAALAPISPDLFNTMCPRLTDGLFVTVELLVLSVSMGFVLAVLMVLARLSGRGVLSFPANVFVYVFRGTPLLVQLWIVYFGIGSLGADNLGILWPFFREAWWVGLLVLTLNTSAYVCEILRGGLANVDHGQMQAAMAIGMSWFKAMRRIMLPQAIRTAWPAYGNEVILMMKGSALISTITVLDLMGQTRTVFSRNFDLMTYFYAAVYYLILAGIITLLISMVEKRFSRGGRR